MSKNEKQVKDISCPPTSQDSTMPSNTGVMQNNKTILIIAVFLYTLITITLFIYMLSKHVLSDEGEYVAAFLSYLPIFLLIYYKEVKMLYLNLSMIPAIFLGIYIVISSEPPRYNLLLTFLIFLCVLPVILGINTICFFIKVMMRRKA